jgi:DNA-binding CsgD family transcriptional regulator
VRNIASAATASEEIVKQYLEKFIDHEISTINNIFSYFPDGVILTKADIMNITGNIHEENLGEDFTNSVRLGWELNAGISLIQGKIISSSMGVYTYPHQPDLSQESMYFLQSITPHIIQAMRIHNHITSLQITYSGLYSVLNAVSYGVFLLGKSGEVLFSNNEAARIIEAQCGLAITRGGVLHHSISQANAQLQASIKLLLKTPTESNPQILNVALTHANSGLPLNVNLLPIHHEQAHLFVTSGASLAIFVKDPNRPLTIPSHYLKQAYQLTDTEITVAQLLLKSLDAATIAEQRNSAIETIRGHIKQLMQKTKTHSQVELVNLLACISNEI